MTKKKENKEMYKLYDSYNKTLKQSNKALRRRQKINAGMREKYSEPYKRRDYNNNKADITLWNSMTNELEENMKMIEMYLDFDDRYYLHKEYNDMKSMIYNQNSYEGIVPLEEIFGEAIPNATEDIVCDVELQEEIVELLGDVLTERQRQVIEMYFWDGMTQEEIGKILGVSRQAINETLSKSLELLRDVCSVQYLDYLQ